MCSFTASLEQSGARPPPEREIAEHDFKIERPDLGPNVTTFVKAGDPIPAHLADLPREGITNR